MGERRSHVSDIYRSFLNGDPDNDVEDREYYYIGDYSRKVTDWNRYPAAMDVREFYGGDLKGVWDKLDYLQDLGVEVLYFNPIFVSDRKSVV